MVLDGGGGSYVRGTPGKRGLAMPLASRQQPTETKVESGTSESKSGTSISFSNGGDPTAASEGSERRENSPVLTPPKQELV